MKTTRRQFLVGAGVVAGSAAAAGAARSARGREPRRSRAFSPGRPRGAHDLLAQLHRVVRAAGVRPRRQRGQGPAGGGLPGQRVQPPRLHEGHLLSPPDPRARPHPEASHPRPASGGRASSARRPGTRSSSASPASSSASARSGAGTASTSSARCPGSGYIQKGAAYRACAALGHDARHELRLQRRPAHGHADHLRRAERRARVQGLGQQPLHPADRREPAGDADPRRALHPRRGGEGRAARGRGPDVLVDGGEGRRLGADQARHRRGVRPRPVPPGRGRRRWPTGTSCARSRTRRCSCARTPASGCAPTSWRRGEARDPGPAAGVGLGEYGARRRPSGTAPEVKYSKKLPHGVQPLPKDRYVVWDEARGEPVVVGTDRLGIPAGVDAALDGDVHGPPRRRLARHRDAGVRARARGARPLDARARRRGHRRAGRDHRPGGARLRRGAPGRRHHGRRQQPLVPRRPHRARLRAARQPHRQRRPLRRRLLRLRRPVQGARGHVAVVGPRRRQGAHRAQHLLRARAHRDHERGGAVSRERVQGAHLHLRQHVPAGDGREPAARDAGRLRARGRGRPPDDRHGEVGRHRAAGGHVVREDATSRRRRCTRTCRSSRRRSRRWASPSPSSGCGRSWSSASTRRCSRSTST